MWCLESCRSYSFNCPESNIVALGTAFEVLFDITGFERKVEALRVAIITLLGDDDAATMRKWVTKFYEERSRAVHLGWALDSTWPPLRRVKRPYGPSGWYQVSAWKVFDACLEAMLTNRNTGNARFVEGLSEFVKSLP